MNQSECINAQASADGAVYRERQQGAAMEFSVPFRVMDSNLRRPVFEVTVDEQGSPLLRFFNREGQAVVEFAVDWHDGHGRVSVNNADGRECIVLDATRDGGNVTARAATNQPEGPTATLGAEGGTAEVSLAVHGSSWNVMRVRG